jgi:hypothetical protein
MSLIKILALAALILIASCSMPASQTASKHEPELKVVKSAGVSFFYRASDFAEVKIEKERKLTIQEIGDGVPQGNAPEHHCFYLKDKRPLPALAQGPRYFSPAMSFICAIPLKDSSVKDFGQAYPELNKAALKLQAMLRGRPVEFKRGDVPDIPYNNSSQTILSRAQYLYFKSGSGILYLTQYAQELLPNPVNNEELTCNFQGLTKDGKYYIAARLAVTHPSLPQGIDFTDDAQRDTRHLYLRKAEKQLAGLPEESFQPSLKNLKALLSSVSTE